MSRVASSDLGGRLVGAFQDEQTPSERMHRLHLENAERVLEAVGALKGAAMKLGQSLALAADEMDLPDDVSQVLSKLHPPFDYGALLRACSAHAIAVAEGRRPDRSPVADAGLMT